MSCFRAASRIVVLRGTAIFLPSMVRLIIGTMDYPFLIDLNLQVSKQAPHLMQMSWMILCGFFFSPMMAPAGQTLLQAVHPLQNSSTMLYESRSLHTPAGQ